MSSNQNVFVATKNGYGLWYDIEEVSVVGIKATGVKSINLKNDEVVSGLVFSTNNDYIIEVKSGVGNYTAIHNGRNSSSITVNDIAINSDGTIYIYRGTEAIINVTSVIYRHITEISLKHEKPAL